MNKKLTIKSQAGGILQTAIFHEQETLDAFLNLLATQHPWGKPEHQKEIQPEIRNEAGEVLQEAVYESVPAEYTVQIEDITSEIEKQNKIKQIEELELQITPRRIREAVLSQDFSFIESIEQQIQLIRQTL